MTTPLLLHSRLGLRLVPALTSFVALAFAGGAFAQEEPKLKDVLEQEEKQ